MALYIGNKKYCAIKKSNVNNTDILITSNGNYTADEQYSGFGLVRVQVPEPIYDELTVTPKTTAQTLNPLNDAFSVVYVNPVTSSIDSNIAAGNIKKGVSILGVTGTLEFTTEELTVTPTTAKQVKTPTKNGYSKVTVNAVTSAIDGNILPANIAQGVVILGVTGTAVLSNETSRNITTNGTYSPEAPYTGFSSVVVDVKVEHEALDVTPTTSLQTFTAVDQYHGYSPITVQAVTADIDSNIVAGNIKSGVSILGVTGTLTELKGQTKTITANGTYTPDSGYNGFTSVTVNVNTVKNQDKTITANGTYTPDNGYTGFGKVTVNINTVNNTNLTVTPKTTSQSFTPASPYTGYGKVTVNAVTSAIDSNITAANIKSGVKILGVTGTLQAAKVQASKTLTVGSSTATTTTITPDSGYDGIASVTVDLTWIEDQLKALNAGDADTTATFQTKTVTITADTATMDVTPDAGYDGLSKVTINMSAINQKINELKGAMVNSDLDDVLDGSATAFASDATTIREYVCYYYMDLKTVKLNNATYIGSCAFGNSGLTTLTISTNQVCTLASTTALDGTPIANGYGHIYVPSSLVASYKADSNWSVYADYISAIA